MERGRGLQKLNQPLVHRYSLRFFSLRLIPSEVLNKPHKLLTIEHYILIFCDNLKVMS